MWLQAMKSGERDVLGGRDHAAHKVDVAVQVAMVDDVDELAAEDRVDVLEVDDHAALRVERSADRHLDDVVVSVVRGACTEELAVLRVAPVVAAEDVRRGERRATGDAHRGGHGSMRKLPPLSGADSGDASHTITRATSAG